MVNGKDPAEVPVIPLAETQKLARDEQHAIDVSFQLVMPEEFPGVRKAAGEMLTQELGHEEAGRVLGILDKCGASRCAGGWLPTDVALNLATQITSLPLATIKAVADTAAGPERGPQRDLLVQRALEQDSAYIFIQDSDVLPPANAFALLKLAMDRAGLDICSGVYFTKAAPCQPLIGLGPDLPFWDGWYNDRWKIHECTLVGNGCLLVRADVFKHIEPPWFLDIGELHPEGPPTNMTDDAHFCMKAVEAGYKIHCYTGVTCGHLDIHRGIVYGFDPKTRGPAWRSLRGDWQPFAPEVVPLEVSTQDGNPVELADTG